MDCLFSKRLLSMQKIFADFLLELLTLPYKEKTPVAFFILYSLSRLDLVNKRGLSSMFTKLSLGCVPTNGTPNQKRDSYLALLNISSGIRKSRAAQLYVYVAHIS